MLENLQKVKQIQHLKNMQQQEEQLDTMSGFFNVYDFNVGVSMQTKLYGFYTPNR